ncbi:MAG TPA: dihydrodipicolinate synthase family protein [Opitutaceae bacterium]|nr:dihydrodipicolinate synthase family protein [Opitutaceae bacterium]
MNQHDYFRQSLTGPISSISTPFDKSGAIDEKALRACVDFAVTEAKSGTILLTYGDSLYSVLTDRDVADVTRIVVEQTARRKMVVAAGCWWTGESIRFAEYCRGLGADMFMPLPPNWAGSCSEQTLVDHFEQVSRVMPVMLVTAIGPGVSVPIGTIRTLMERETQIVAIKDDICGPYGRRLAALNAGRWAFLSGGRKENHLDQLPYGKGPDSYLSLYMRFKPAVAHRYWEAITAGRIDEAVEIINRFDIPFMNFCATHGVHFDAVVHGAMELAGITQRWRRSPYSTLNDDKMEKLKSFFAEAGEV